MNGLLNVLKPPGMTSHDVVAFVRRLTASRVGHTGTLDPAAAGVLILIVGSATRIAELLALDDKTYRAEFVLGRQTTTGDLEGEVVREDSAAHVTEEQASRAAATLTGDLDMLPPMFSAVKQGGQKLYELAKEGKAVERRPRRVTVYEWRVLAFHAGVTAHCLCEVSCSKGTYIRSLAEMLGERLGCPACVGFLLRTRVGLHHLDKAATLQELDAAAQEGRIGDLLIRLQDALPEVAQVEVSSEEAQRLGHGNQVACREDLQQGARVLAVHGGEVVCLAEVGRGQAGLCLQPRKVLVR